MTATLSDSERENASHIVALFTVLIHAWKTNDFHEAARTSGELERLGVKVRIPRRGRTRKGANDAQ